MSATLRSGRLAPTRKDVVRFISSIDQDRRIARSVILVNEAHVVALAKARVINLNSARKLLRALKQIEKNPPYQKGVEDIHVLIEDYVTKQVGRDMGGMLNAGKSRNDQVVTAIRMTLRESLLELSGMIIRFEKELLSLAEANRESLFVGYTHQQPAQPITFAHYLLAVGDAFLRDNQRVMETYARVNMCPMGAAALAGTSFDIDRSLVARLLGFQGLVENSLDAVGSRDFILDALHACSALALDLARIAQDFIFYSSVDVAVVELPDEFASTSSIMPQKKNPDVLELVRARSAKAIGNYSSGGSLLHSLPTGYNLDFQELTPIVWDSLDGVCSCLQMMTQLLPKIKVQPPRRRPQTAGFIVAAEIANVLVREEGVSFRKAHHVVGGAVKTVLEKGQDLANIDREHWERGLGKNISEKTFHLIRKIMNPSRQVEVYKTLGSSGPVEIHRMITLRRKQMENMGNFEYSRKSRATIAMF